ncbi:hypothetical protein Tco_0962136, partial [Tanacetum coccineum]
SSAIPTSFFSNNVVQYFQDNSAVEVDENKGLVIETYDWDEKEVTFDDEKMVELKILMVLPDDEKLTVGKEHARNSEWINIISFKTYEISKEKQAFRDELKEKKSYY